MNNRTTRKIIDERETHGTQLNDPLASRHFLHELPTQAGTLIFIPTKGLKEIGLRLGTNNQPH